MGVGRVWPIRESSSQNSHLQLLSKEKDKTGSKRSSPERNASGAGLRSRGGDFGTRQMIDNSAGVGAAISAGGRSTSPEFLVQENERPARLRSSRDRLGNGGGANVQKIRDNLELGGSGRNMERERERERKDERFVIKDFDFE